MRNLFFIIIFVFLSSICHAEDGTYDATVTTESGTYTVPVEVEDGEVTYIHWPNGGDMSVSGAEIADGEATGTNSKGETVQIELDDYIAEDGSALDDGTGDEGSGDESAGDDGADE